ncbi:MAG: chromosome segregation protein SMC, partial [Candidatus Lindowbacteria bacterium]|nr:chromosome segregation protein SMC [Candidatus Lindowbacteria bacterium]
MVLKRVEIFGFKSFADRTVVEFTSGITAIVGPNGCGKSNVSDSIRWVLGEQSAKSLRGTKMQDVIFSGTTKRNPLGFCEVILTFDNRQKLFPVESAEVSIGRRLFRSGESDYLINKKPCRLRDVHDLLMDSGIGRRAHAIIEQGKIDEIVTALPEQRRTIIEEAAGIAKYRSRRKEALRKLTAAREGLQRVDDLIGELERQQSSLKRAARKAEKFTEVKKELKDQEISVARLEGRNLETRISAIREQVSEHQDQIVTAELDSTTSSKEITELEQVLEELRQEQQRRARELSQSEQEASAAEARLMETKARLSDDERNIETQEHEINEIQLQLTQADENSESCTATLSEVSVRSESLQNEISEVSGLLATTVEALTAIENEKTALERQSADTVQALVRFESEKHHLEETMQTASVREENLIARRVQLIADRERMEETRTTLIRENQEIERKNGELENSRRELAAKSGQSIESFNRLRDQIATCEKELAVYQDRHSAAVTKADMAVEEIRQLLKDEQARLSIVPISEYVSFAPEYTRAFSSALGEVISGVLVNAGNDGISDPDLEQIAEQLNGRFVAPGKGHGANRSTREWTPKVEGTALRNYLRDDCPGSIRKLLAGWYVAETDDQARLLLDSIDELEQVVTISGTVYSSGGSIRVARSSEADELASGREKLSEEIQVLNTKVAELLLKSEEERAQSTEIEEQMREIDGMVRKVWEERNDIRNQISGISERLESDGLEQLERSIEETRSEIAISRERSVTLVGEVEAYSEKQITIDQARSSKDENYFELKSKVDETRELRSEKINEISLLNERKHSRESELQTLSLYIESARSTLERYQNHRDELQSRKTESESTIATLGTRTAELSRVLEEKRNVFQQIETQVEDQATLLTSHQEKFRHATKSKEKASEKLHSIDVEKVELTGEWKHIVERIDELYSVKIEPARQDEDFEGKADPERLLELRTMLERMGTGLNFAAAEELEETANRLEFYHEQRTDLEHAGNGLEQVVNEIDQKTIALFMETLNAVNTNFGLLFNNLFKGADGQDGHAELVLLDPSNPLESGIDIVARPPGKKPQSITLLSGGEK